MGASQEAAGGAVSCRCHSPPHPPQILSDGWAHHLLAGLLGSTQLPVREPPSCLGGGINSCQPPFHTLDNKREPPWQRVRKINTLPEPWQLNTLAYLTEVLPGKKKKKAASPRAGGGGANGPSSYDLGAAHTPWGSEVAPSWFATPLGKPRFCITSLTTIQISVCWGGIRSLLFPVSREKG